jgi:RHS repeat-associated protein
METEDVLAVADNGFRSGECSDQGRTLMTKQLSIGRLTAFVAVALAVVAPDSQAAIGRTRGLAAVSDSGQATYSIPLHTPPGTNGLTPSLSLNYSSNAGNGIFGNGWSLSGLSGIARCGSTWAQDGVAREPRNDSFDKFCLDGQKLRLVSGTYGQAGSTYRTEIESFSRITANGIAGNGPASFTVETKDGLVYTYGGTDDSRIESLGQSTIRFWAVSRIRDRSSVTDGNAIKFAYTKDATYGSFRISTIQYAENPAQSVTAPYTISFNYEPIPSGEIDAIYAEGAQIRRVVRATQINVTHSNGTLIRRYNLSYEPTLSSTSKSRLASIQECAGVAPNCFSPTIFTYQNGTNGLGAEVLTSATIPFTASRPFPMDVNGDGRDDLVYTSSDVSGGGSWMVLLANASGGYSSPINTGIANVNYAGATTIDYDSDGRRDLLVPYSGGTWWVMLGSSGGLSAPTNTGAPATASGTGWNAQGLDVDGDGREDLVWADLYGWGGGDVIRYRSRLAGSGFSSSATDLTSPMPVNTRIESAMFQSGSLKLHRSPDFNGDGRADLSYKVSNREWGDFDWVYYYSVQIVCPGGPNFGYGSGIWGSRPDYVDLNGDGRTDVIYRGGTTQLRFRFSTGTSFTAEYFGPSLTGYTTNPTHIFDWDRDGNEDVLLTNTNTNTLHLFRSTGVGLAAAVDTGVPTRGYITATDINGDGLTDLGFLNGNTWAFRLHSGVYPDLMLSATDAFGVSDSFSYASLPGYAYYTKGAGSEFPTQDVTPVMNVVATLTSSDGTGPNNTYTLNTHTYEGARFNLQGRGFLGFSYKSWRDSRDSTAQRRTYRQDFPYIGSLTNAKRTQEPTGLAISETQILYANHPYSSGNSVAYFPYPQTVTNLTYAVAEGSYNGALVSTVASVNGFDSSSGALSSRTVTVTEPSSGSGGLSTNAGMTWTAQTQITPTNYSSGGNWCLGRPTVVTQTNSHGLSSGGPIARTTNSTWDASHCRLTQIVDEPGSQTLQVTTDISYDAYGNRSQVNVTGINMPVRSTTTSYAHIDGPGQFPTTITNALNQASVIAWDYALAVPDSLTDPNELVTSWSYDEFGRRTGENRPDNTYTNLAIQACTSGCDSRAKWELDTYVYDSANSITANTRQQMDQFDRSILEHQRRADSQYNVTTRSFDSFGRLSSEYFPYSSASNFGYATIGYDLLDRPTTITRPVSDAAPTPTQTTNIYYDGLTTRVVDAEGKQSKRIMTAAGSVARSIDHTDVYYQGFDYDAFGNVTRVFDSEINLQTSSYNNRGMLLSRTNAGMGTWTYNPNALGEVINVRDAKTTAPLWTQTFSYDPLGRLTQRSEPEGISTWTWGEAAHNTAANKYIGKLKSVAGPGYSEQYTNDFAARLLSTRIDADDTYYIHYSYNSAGLLDTLTYPASTSSNPLKLKYDYQNGFLYRISDFYSPNTAFWTGSNADARNRWTQETTEIPGDDIVSEFPFDAVSGLPKASRSKIGTTFRQNLEFEWDRAGNLERRRDVTQSGLTEEFSYDNLHRLTSSSLSTTGVNLTMTYDARGNIITKSGEGTDNYHSIGLGSSNITWTSYNYPACITTGSTCTSASPLYAQFSYTPDRRYWKQSSKYVNGEATTIYIGGLFEKVTTPATGTDFRHYIRAGSTAVIVSRRTNGVNSYVHVARDHIGSASLITDNLGVTALKASYDAFGRRRGSSWTGAPTAPDWSAIAASTRRGFTDHTMMDNLEVTHMNGRVYDPVIGQFLSPDPFIPDPLNTQSYNRYSYVQNNPLSLVDPSGFTPDGPNWHWYWPNWNTPWIWPTFPTYRPPAVVSPCGHNNCVNNKPLPAMAPVSATPCDQMPCGQLDARAQQQMAEALRAAFKALADAKSEENLRAEFSSPETQAALGLMLSVYPGGSQLIGNMMVNAERGVLGQTAANAAAQQPVAARGVHASTPVGRTGSWRDTSQITGNNVRGSRELKVAGAQAGAPPVNSPATIGGRNYSGHALDRMQERGYVPSVVEDAIRTGTRAPSYGGASSYYSSSNNVTVIVDDVTGNVVTVRGGP